MFIFLYGVDNFRSLEKLSDLKNKYLEKNGSGTDLSVLDYGEGASVENLSTAFSAQGLFSTKRLVIVKNSMLKGSTEVQKGILTLLKANPDTEKDADTIVIFYENGSPKKNGALYKFLFKAAKRQEFTPLEGTALANWALTFAKTLSTEISFTKNALNMLLAATGSDLNVLSNEINKLVNYKNSGEIVDADVVLLVKSKVDSTMFETIEALASGNKSKALDLFHQQLTKGEDVFYILSMYTYQIRTLLKIGDFYWQGMISAPQIAQASGIHPYVVQKSLSQIRNLSEQKTKQMLRDLAEIDFSAKTGKVDPVLALDTFIVSL
ncbi:MAG TPA: DNA polymerase III subunit delta [Candidatus Moranbacteria bacterium]|nr:DNA polymerase III subunit delta [Candidatus Moranbacteria bacterium]HCO99420.1 DNA polymerase III subunit delta [Candidatus Moranbacteria bacterium]